MSTINILIRLIILSEAIKKRTGNAQSAVIFGKPKLKQEQVDAAVLNALKRRIDNDFRILNR